jgi:hypothetical protein
MGAQSLMRERKESFCHSFQVCCLDIQVVFYGGYKFVQVGYGVVGLVLMRPWVPVLELEDKQNRKKKAF